MQALKLYLRVHDDGTVEIPPLDEFKGKKIEVVILESDESIEDLIIASESSTDFWNNPVDDEAWNNV